jgi:hypothetical protein
LERVKTKMSLHVLAYNLKRLIAILGMAKLMDAIRAYALLLQLQRPLWSIFSVVHSETDMLFATLQNAFKRSGMGRCFQNPALDVRH